MPFETFEHTADIGLRVRALTLDQLFQDAAQGFFDLVTDISQILRAMPQGQDLTLEVHAENTEELFLAWLKELLYVFSAQKKILYEYKTVLLEPNVFKTEAKFIPFDPKKHDARHEIKGVTRHRFKLIRTKNEWLAEIIFDI